MWVRLHRSIQPEFGEPLAQLWEQGVPSSSLGAPTFACTSRSARLRAGRPDRASVELSRLAPRFASW